jgi:hypothetical protein
MRTTHSRRTAGVVLAGGLFLVPLAGCSGDEPNTGSSALTDASDAAEDAGDAAGEATEEAGDAAASATSAAGDAAEAAEQAVDCSGTSCTVTLSPNAGDVEVLGTRIAYEGVENGEATVTVGNDSFSCAEGETIDAGPLSLECTTVSDDELVMTASLG